MASGGEEPDQPRQPRNIQGLLKFALETTKDEDAPDDAQYLQPMDEERRRFLEDALRTLTVDTVVQMENAIKTIMDPNADDCSKVDALPMIIDYVYDIDTSNDFYKIGGFVIINPGLHSSSIDLKKQTLLLISELAQNNPFCQKHLLELNILPRLLELLCVEGGVAERAMKAVSSMVRGYEPCLATFIEIGGLECVLGCIQTDNETLRIRSLFLMSSICREFPAVGEEFIKLNAVERVVASIKPSKSHDPKLEAALSVLSELTKSAEGIRRCQDANLHLKSKLTTIIMLSSGIDECQEQGEYASNLMKQCFLPDANDGTDR